MSLIDWLLLIIPVCVVCYIGMKTKKYTQDVADFLAGGRVAGRYVLVVASGQAAVGLISMVASFEMIYKSGGAVGFWGGIATPILIVLGLTGFITYRYRETRAMTLAQFFEMRYSRNFRVFTGILQAVAGIVNYGLFPAVGARFFIYYANLPFSIDIAGIPIPTYALLMFIFLGIAVLIATMGGQVGIMAVNALQGILSYPMYLIITVTILCSFSWWDHFVPVMANRPPGESFIDPFDTYNLRDFNLFYVMVGIFAGVYNMRSWQGTQGFYAAAINAHEQKIAGVLGAWSGGFSGIMWGFIVGAALVWTQHPDFKERWFAHQPQFEWKVLNDIAPDAQGQTLPNVDQTAVQQRKEQLGEKKLQMVKTISSQMLVPVVLREIFPVGVTGLFAAVMFFLMVSTDASYLHSWSAILVQDFLLPLRKKTWDTKRHLLYLRIAIVAIAAYAFVFSLFFGQVTYILMFFALTGSLWLGGAGSVIIGGLYWRKGTTAGAWAAVIGGGVFAALSFLCTQYWADWIYPALAKNPEMLSWVSKLFETMSRPFEPIILWRVTPEKFPINGQELYFLNILLSIALYIVISLLTCKEPFNMDRLLHRGIYARKDEGAADIEAEKKMTFKEKCFKMFIGIDSQYTRGDKILAWSVFIYSFFYGYGLWLLVLIWNLIHRWPIRWFAISGFITSYWIAIPLGVVSTIWFFIGTIVDLKKLFYRLATRQRNEKDDGRVIGHVSADEVEMVEKIEHRTIEKEQ